jgi:Fe-S-cluster containining protein
VNPIEQLRDDFDKLLARGRAAKENKFQPACDQCQLDACCYEPVFADKQEVADILSRLSPERIVMLKLDVTKWLLRAKPLLQRAKEGLAFDYRDAAIRCPFLFWGRCSIYAFRPFSCRSHFALSNPENCKMPARKEQKYAMWKFDRSYREIIIKYMAAIGGIEIDHLGLLIYNELFGFNEESAAAEKYQIEKEESK